MIMALTKIDTKELFTQGWNRLEKISKLAEIIIAIRKLKYSNI
jgi:hypothetical protein